jgi:GTP-binding protein
MLFKQARQRVATAELNRVVREALERNPPPLHKNHRPKVFYATQVSVQPPTIVLFCNDPLMFSEPYRRYLLGVFREKLKFSEVPIKLYLRKRQQGDQRDEVERPSAKQATASKDVPEADDVAETLPDAVDQT